MKKFLIIILIISALSTQGCKKSKTEQQTTPPQSGQPQTQKQMPYESVLPQSGQMPGQGQAAAPTGPLTPENVSKNPMLFIGKRVTWSGQVDSASLEKSVFKTTADGKEDDGPVDLTAVTQSHVWFFVANGSGGQALFSQLQKTHKIEALFADVTGTIAGQTKEIKPYKNTQINLTVPVLTNVKIRPRMK